MDAIRLTINGVDHEVAFDECTAVDAKECRKQTGLSLQTVLGTVAESPDLDSVAVLLWLAHRQKGINIPYDVVARDVTYGSKFEITSIDVEPSDPGE